MDRRDFISSVGMTVATGKLCSSFLNPAPLKSEPAPSHLFESFFYEAKGSHPYTICHDGEVVHSGLISGFRCGQMMYPVPNKLGSWVMTGPPLFSLVWGKAATEDISRLKHDVAQAHRYLKPSTAEGKKISVRFLDCVFDNLQVRRVSEAINKVVADIPDDSLVVTYELDAAADYRISSRKAQPDAS